MIVKNIFRLFIFISLYGCSGNSDSSETREQPPQFGHLAANEIGEKQFDFYDEKQFGLYIKNPGRRGMWYIDPTNIDPTNGGDWYFSYTITIRNDTLIPVHLDISFPETGWGLKDSIKSIFFLLPEDLTLSRVMSKEELQWFLDVGKNTPVYLSKTLNPTETCAMTFGILTNTKHNPTTSYDSKLFTSPKNASELSVKFKMNEKLTIPCGHITYINK
jgi:hypothetical protein